MSCEQKGQDRNASCDGIAGEEKRVHGRDDKPTDSDQRDFFPKENEKIVTG